MNEGTLKGQTLEPLSVKQSRAEQSYSTSQQARYEANALYL
jgi:hypothetical protein